MADSLQHAQFFSNAQTVFCVVGFEGCFRQINAAFETTLGYDRATLLKMEFLELVHPVDKKSVEKLLEDISFSNQVQTLNCQIIDAHQQYREFVWQLTPSPKEFGFYAVGIEISNYKYCILQEADAEAHEQLTIFQEKYADLQLLVDDLQQKVPTFGDDDVPLTPVLQLVQEGVIFQHKNGKIYPINEKQVRRILGNIPTIDQFILLWEAAKDNPKPETPTTFLWLKKNGKIIHLDVCARTILDVNQEIIGRAISFVDITEQHTLKTKIDSLQEQTTLEIQNGGMLTWDLLTHEVIFSGSWKKLLGYHDDDLSIGKRIEAWYSRIHPSEYNQVFDSLKCYIEGNCPKFESEHRIVHKDGSYRWVLVKGKVLKDRSGHAYRFMGVFTDITERRTIVDSESNNKASFSPHDILNVLSDAIFSVNTKTYKLEHINKAACNLYGYSLQEFENLLIYQLYPDRVAFNHEWKLMLKEQLQHIPVTYQKKKSGETFVAEINGGIYKWQENTFLLLIIRDITARRNIETAIREERQQYGTAFHSAPFMILCKDRYGKIIKANRYAIKILNKRPEQLVGLIEQQLKMNFSEHYYQVDTHILQTGESVLGLVEKYQDHFYHVDKIPYRDAAGNILGILVFFIDVDLHLSEHSHE